MKRLFFLAAMLGATALSHPAQAAFDCKDGAITIGIARAMTGDFAFFDVAGARGLEIGVDEINAAGGVDGCMIKLISGDTQSNPAQTGQVADELIKQGAKLIIAPSDFDAGVGASMAAQEAGLFSMSPEASSVPWTQAVKPNFVIGAMTEEDLGRAIGSFVNEKGWKNAYVVTNTAYSFFTNQEKSFRDVFKGKVVGQDTVKEDTADYSAVVSKIRAAGDSVDVVFINDYFPHVGTFLKQLRAAGIKTAVVGNSTFSSPTLPEVVGAEGLQNVYYVASAYFEGKDIDPGLKKMIDAYQKKFATFPENSNSIVAYYAAYILADALKTAGSTNADGITKAILAQKDFKVPGAIFYEWKDRYPSVSAAVVGFDAGGAFRQIELIDPRTIK